MTSVQPAANADAIACAAHVGGRTITRFRCVQLQRLMPLVALAASLVPGRVQSQSRADSLRARTSLDSVRVSRALIGLRAAARLQSPALRAARSGVELATARAAASGLRAAATFSAGLSEAPARTLDQGNLRLEIGRDLFTAPRRQAERALADVDVRVATIDVSLEERRLDGIVLRDVVLAAGARRIARRLAAEDLLLAGAEDGVRGRFGVAQARYVDVLRVRTERLRVQTERSGTIADARGARARLAAVLVGSEALPTLDAVIDTVADVGLGDAWRGLLPSLPSLDSLLAQSDAARMADVEAARTEASRALVLVEQRRQVNAYAGIQRIGQANNGPTFGPSFGVTMSLPFTAAQRNRLAAAAALQGVTTSRLARDAALSEARGRLDAARERYSAARERLETFDAALLRGARDERESALQAYRTGSLSLLELLDFERALSRAEIERTRALIDAADAWADLQGANEPSQRRSDAGTTSPSAGR